MWSSSHNATEPWVGVHWKESRSSQGCAETQDIKSGEFGGRAQGYRTIWFQCFSNLYLMWTKNNAHYFPLFLMAVCFPCVCTALTEPGQLPLSSHRAARLVRRSPGLPATFWAKPHGMSDGMQTLIMVFTGFFRCFLGDVSKTIIRFWILRKEKWDDVSTSEAFTSPCVTASEPVTVQELKCWYSCRAKVFVTDCPSPLCAWQTHTHTYKHRHE